MDGNVARFRQLFLPSSQLAAYDRASAGRQPDWVVPLPDQPIATLTSEPDDLEKRFGLGFQDTMDDLDYFKIAVVELASGLRLSLIRYRGSPMPGTNICIVLPARAIINFHDAQVTDLRRSLQVPALAQLTHAFDLTPEEFSWRQE